MKEFEFTHYECRIDNGVTYLCPFLGGIISGNDIRERLLFISNNTLPCEGVKAGEVYPKDQVEGPIWQVLFRPDGEWQEISEYEVKRHQDQGWQYRKIYRLKQSKEDKPKLSDKIAHINCDPEALKDPGFLNAVNSMAEHAHNMGKQPKEAPDRDTEQLLSQIKAGVIVGYKCKLCGAEGSFDDFPYRLNYTECGKEKDTFCRNPDCDGENEDLEEIVEWAQPTDTNVGQSETAEECNHMALMDTGIGYYHCPSCNNGWTYAEWDKLNCEEPEETVGKAANLASIEYANQQYISRPTIEEESDYIEAAMDFEAGFIAGVNWYKKQQEGK